MNLAQHFEELIRRASTQLPPDVERRGGGGPPAAGGPPAPPPTPGGPPAGGGDLPGIPRAQALGYYLASCRTLYVPSSVPDRGR
jgi:hypothetical protein